MALTRAKKAQKVEMLAAELQGSTSAIVGTFTKLTVAQDFELRRKVREAGGKYRVLKNKLASRASEGTEIAGALQGLKGVSSVAYTSGDPVALAKALSTWVKENAAFTFKLGIVDGKVINVEEVQALATMPSKEEIFAKLLFLISAPAQRLATVMAAAGRDLAVVLNQGVEKNKFAAGEVEAAPVVEAAAVGEAPASPESAVPAGKAGSIETTASEPVAAEPIAPETAMPEPVASESVIPEAIAPEVVEAVAAPEAEAAVVPETGVAEADSVVSAPPIEEASVVSNGETSVFESQAEAAVDELPVEGK